MWNAGIRLIAVVAIALAASASNVSAALVTRHLLQPGDDLLTFDTSTRLLWLDLTATAGLSYNEALASTYVSSMGYRFATPNELLTLYTSAGIQPGSSLDQAPALNCFSIFWVALLSAADDPGQGWLDMSDPLDTAYGYFQLNPVQNGPPVIYVGVGFLPTSTFVSRDP